MCDEGTGLLACNVAQASSLRNKAWQAGTEGFEFPGGELRADFRKRVERGLQRIQDGGVASALVVTHKGVIRTITEILTGTPLDRTEPPLGSAVLLTLGAKGWFVGQRSSDQSV